MYYWRETLTLTNTLENGLANSSRNNPMPIIWNSNSTSRFLLKKNENINPYKDLHVRVYNSFINYNQKLAMMPMSIYWRMDKQSVAYLYNGLLLNNEQEQTTDTFDMVELLKTLLSSESHRQKWACSVVQFIRNTILDKKSSIVSESRSILGGHVGTHRNGQNIQYLGCDDGYATSVYVLIRVHYTIP